MENNITQFFSEDPQISKVFQDHDLVEHKEDIGRHFDFITNDGKAEISSADASALISRIQKTTGLDRPRIEDLMRSLDEAMRSEKGIYAIENKILIVGNTPEEVKTRIPPLRGGPVGPIHPGVLFAVAVAYVVYRIARSHGYGFGGGGGGGGLRDQLHQYLKGNIGDSEEGNISVFAILPGDEIQKL